MQPCAASYLRIGISEAGAVCDASRASHVSVIVDDFNLIDYGPMNVA